MTQRVSDNQRLQHYHFVKYHWEHKQITPTGFYCSSRRSVQNLRLFSVVKLQIINNRISLTVKASDFCPVTAD